MSLDKASLRQRAATLKEAGQAPLTDNDLKDLNEKLLETLRDELGIELGAENSLPTGDPPRIFVTSKDKDGREVLRAPAEAVFPSVRRSSGSRSGWETFSPTLLEKNPPFSLAQRKTGSVKWP